MRPKPWFSHTYPKHPPSPYPTLHAHVMLVEPNTGMVISKMLRLRLLDLDSLPDGKELFEALAEARQF